MRWDIALRDLDVALDLDSDADGKLTWGEVRAAWPRIEAYALQRLTIEGCALTATGRGLERRNDGAYAVLYLSSPCALPTPPRIVYSLFADVDPTHRGIAKVQRPGQDVVPDGARADERARRRRGRVRHGIGRRAPARPPPAMRPGGAARWARAGSSSPKACVTS